jgi:hypothetical protein
MMDGAMSVREARERYFAANGFGTATYDAPTFRITGLPIDWPNTPARRRAIPLHDLHHVATGYGTDFTGEAEIGAWELRAGCDSLALYVLNGGAALIGLVIAPLRTLRAWRRARGAVSLYRLHATAPAFLDSNVAELRARLQIPARGLADAPAGLHRAAPALR